MSIMLNKIKKEAIIFCPLCDREYKPTNLQIVKQTGEIALAHSHCPHCEGAIMSILYQDMMGITLVGLVTDLNYQDAVRINKIATVGEDDVLELFESINNI